MLNAPTEKISKTKKPTVRKTAGMTALRNQAKDIRAEITGIRKTRTAANMELREAQKKVRQIDTMLAKRQRALDRVKARIDMGVPH